MGERFRDHAVLDLASRRVDLVEDAGQFARFGRVVGREATDAEAHVVQSSGRIDARADGEAEIGGGQARCITPRHFDQCTQANTSFPLPQAAHSRRDEGAVARIEWNKIGNRAHGHQIEQRRQVGIVRAYITSCTHRRPQRRQHVERDTDARQHLARKRIAVAIRIDDRVGIGQRFAGQMMIGDQHVPTASTRRSDAGMTGDAVIDGDQQFGFQRRELLDEPRRQAVPVAHAIRHRE